VRCLLTNRCRDALGYLSHSVVWQRWASASSGMSAEKRCRDALGYMSHRAWRGLTTMSVSKQLHAYRQTMAEKRLGAWTIAWRGLTTMSVSKQLHAYRQTMAGKRLGAWWTIAWRGLTTMSVSKQLDACRQTMAGKRLGTWAKALCGLTTMSINKQWDVCWRTVAKKRLGTLARVLCGRMFHRVSSIGYLHEVQTCFEACALVHKIMKWWWMWLDSLRFDNMDSRTVMKKKVWYFFIVYGFFLISSTILSNLQDLYNHKYYTHTYQLTCECL
jgi:hypothetical protein